MSLEFITCNLLARRVRRETLDDKPHLVVPTVMVVEGVLNGSDGPLLYPGTELAKTPSVWDHKPLIVNHPQDGRACRPDVLRRRKIGVILNTSWEAPKLRTEAWIDIAAANRIDKRIIENLEASRRVEVSSGLWVDVEPQSGVLNGKSYNGIARNYRPDHLAVLPDAVGACSVQDGAGMLQLNQQRIVVSVIPHSPTFAIINFSDGTYFPVEGDARTVERRVTEAMNGVFIPSLAESIDPLKNVSSLLPSTQGPVLMETPYHPNTPAQMHLIDCIQAVYGSPAGVVANAGCEVNESPLPRVVMNFDDRLPSQSGKSATLNQDDEPLPVPKWDFSDRLKKGK